MSETAFSETSASDGKPDGLYRANPAGGPAESNTQGATPMAKKISGSVGKGGKNKPESPTDDGSRETFLKTKPADGEGMMANPTPVARSFDILDDEPEIGILVGLLLPAVTAVRENKPGMPSDPSIPSVEKGVDQPLDPEQEMDAATNPSDIDLFAAGLAETQEELQFNFIEIKGSSPTPEEDHLNGLLLAPDTNEDPTFDQIIAGATRTHGDTDKPNDPLIGGDGADGLSDTKWLDFVDDVLV